MKITVNRSLLIGIAILHSHIWIVLAEEIVKAINYTKDDDRRKEGQEDESKLQTLLSLFISSSFITTANSSRLFITETPYTAGTATLSDINPASLLNASIQDSSIDEVSYHHTVHATASPLVDVPTSYLLNSLYLLESSYLLKNSFYLLDNTNSHDYSETDFHTVLASSSSVLPLLSSLSSSLSLSSTSSLALQDFDLSIQEVLHPYPEDVIQKPVSSPDITHAPSAESRFLTRTSYEIPSPSNVFVYESTKTSEAIQNNNGQINKSIYSQIQHDHLSNFYSPYDDDAQFKENQPTASLTEQVNTDFSNFLIETSVIIPNNQDKESSTKHMLDLESQAATLHEISTSVSEPLSVVTFNSSETRSDIDFSEEVNNSSNTYSHEITNDNKAMNNKTSRNEDAEIEEIISGIIHLLAGNVQVVRPTKNVLGMYPTRLHMPPPPALVSTRINNRGPIKPNGFSRTVVVFSQPPNKGNPTELALPGHLLPSTIQNHQFVRIRPTKIGDHPPSTMIHFYNQVLNPPQLVPQPNLPFPPPHHQIPFRGEVFNPNNRPNPNNKVRITVPPEEFVKPSFTNPEKQHSVNGNPGNKYHHFIFSDNAASSVIVLRPSKPPPVETFINTHPDRHKAENSNYKNTSQSFEVLIDDTVKKKVFVSQMNPVSSNNFDVFNEKLTSYTPLTSDTVIFATKTENIFPHGPVTDWVPFSERPSVRPNETNSFAEDSNVSIIMHPIIFDITVSNSVGEIEHSRNATLNEDNSSITITDTETHSTSLDSASGTTERYPSSDTEYLTTSSKIFDKEYLQDESELISSKILMNHATPVSEIRSLISKTTDAFTSPTIDMTSTYTIDSITKPLTITPNFDLRSSYNQGNSYTESETVTENTENMEVPSRLSSSTISSSISSAISIENTANTSNVNGKSSISSMPNISRTSSIPNISRTSSVLSISSTSTTPKKSTLTSTQTNEPTLIGRPIVIPVDIEEVRPFVGPINPLNQDQNRENQYQRPFPKDQGSSTENIYRTISSTTTRTPIIRSQQRPRPNTVRIDTCIVGDDSTCDITLNETCKTEMGISSCHCRPGYARSYARGPCIPIVSLMLSMKVDRFGNKKMAFSPKYLDKNSEEYRLMEFESKLALSSLISQIPAFARTFLGLQINTFYPIGDKIVINSTIFLEEKESTRTQAVRLRLRQLIGEAIKNKKQNIGDSRLFVEGSYSPVTAIEDVNECSDANLNDCSSEGMCFNVFGTYLCKCKSGYVDPFIHDERRSGRKCSACSPEYCSFHGKCFVERDKRLCKCHGNYIGSRCEIDGEVLGVALGASLAAIIIILLTLGCLCIWNRKWKQQQQKAEVLSSRSYNSNQTFSYVGNMMNSNTNPYHLTMEDRMRWAQISDVIKNASMQPNPDHPYLSPTPAPLDQANFSNRCQPSEDEISWYESRNRSRSRVTGQYPGVSAPSCFEMDIPVRPPYAGAGYLSSKRPKHHPTIPTIRY